MTRLVEDLLFESVAWWEITTFDASGYPLHVHRCEPERVNTRDGKVYYLDPKTNRERQLTDAQVIRFTSANDALLVAGARAIRACLMLDATAARYADEPMPTGYFTPRAGESDPEDDTKVTGILADWQTARQTRSTGYIPVARLPHDDHLAQRPAASRRPSTRRLEIARVAGIDPEELGVSTTSRTYANAFDRRKQFIDFTLGGYLTAIADRLSMPDVTPPGNYARFNLDAFLRSDALARYQAYAAGLGRRAGRGRHCSTRRQAHPERTHHRDPHRPARRRRPALGRGRPHPRRVRARDVRRRPGGPHHHRPRRPLRAGGHQQGPPVPVLPGSLQWTDPTRVKLYIGHDPANAVGYAAQLDDRADGLYPVFKVARGPEGDRASRSPKTRSSTGCPRPRRGRHVRPARRRPPRQGRPARRDQPHPCPAFDDARVAVAAGADPAAVTFTGEAGHALTSTPRSSRRSATRSARVSPPSPTRRPAPAQIPPAARSTCARNCPTGSTAAAASTDSSPTSAPCSPATTTPASGSRRSSPTPTSPRCSP